MLTPTANDWANARAVARLDRQTPELRDLMDLQPGDRFAARGRVYTIVEAAEVFPFQQVASLLVDTGASFVHPADFTVNEDGTRMVPAWTARVDGDRVVPA